MLMISGLDMFIVGHYDYKEQASTPSPAAPQISCCLFPVCLALYSPRYLPCSRAQRQAGWRAVHQDNPLLSFAALPAWNAAFLRRLSSAQLMGRNPMLPAALSISKCWWWATSFVTLPIHMWLRSSLPANKSATIATIAEAWVNIVLSIWLVQRLARSASPSAHWWAR